MVEGIIVRCPSCRSTYRVARELLGNQTRCARCGTRFRIEPCAGDGPPGATVAGCVLCGRPLRAAEAASDAEADVCTCCRGSERFTEIEPSLQLLRMVRQHPAADAHQPLPELAEHEVEKTLGTSPHSVVFLMRSTRGDQHKVLKVMRSEIAVSDAALRRFRREVSIVRQLEHPHIVKVREEGRVDQLFYFTMDYYARGSVDSLIRESGTRLPLALAANLMLQVLGALDFAHQQEVGVDLEDGSQQRGTGVVHRDVKPANILLDEDADGLKAVLADFGLAKAFELAGFSGITMTGASVGTIPFMPREQAIDAKHVGPASDVWSAAATFYYMLTGAYPREPVGRMTPWEVVTRGRLVPIIERAPALPQRLAGVFDAALAHRAADRFQTASQFRRELEKVL